MHVDFTINEAVVFGLVAASYGLVLWDCRCNRHGRWLVYGHTALLIGAGATVFETFMIPEILNIVEHLVGLAGAASLFAIYAYHGHTRATTLNTQRDGADA